MKTTRTRAALAAAVTAGGLLGALTLPVPGVAAAAVSEGVTCNTGTAVTGGVAFDLYATDGYLSTPDGNSIYAWGYSTAPTGFQLPGPNLCVNDGAAVTITLHNRLPEPVSITMPGLPGVMANGAPAQPVFDSLGAVTSLVAAAPVTTPTQEGVATYTFTASRPGTFVYESGTDVDKQLQMGLYGALIVRPTNHTSSDPNVGFANERADSAYDTRHEYIYLLSEVDPAFHLAVEKKKAFDLSKYRARYFFINGRAMPDTLAPNNAAWLPSQPYGAMIHIQPQGDPAAGYQQYPSLVRYLNIGPVNYPFHPHGSDQLVIDQDAHALQGTAGEDLAYDKFLIDLAPGQTADTLLTWKDVEQWDPVTQPIPVDLPNLSDQIVGPGETWFSESPYLGTQNSLPDGVTAHNVCGEYYQIAHSHALQQATNYGASFGGMMTLIRIDPPSINANANDQLCIAQ